MKDVAIFSSLGTEVIDRLDRRCRWRNYPAGSEMIAFRDSAKDVHFLISGSALVMIRSGAGKDVAFRSATSGSVFGEFAAIDGEPRSASVRLLEPSLVATMPAWDFRSLLADEPDVAMALLRHLTAELRRLTARIPEFSTLAVSNRIQAELIRLAGGAEPTRARAVIEHAPTHSVIASRVSTHREAVTKELSRLTRLGLINRQGKHLIIEDMIRLVAMVRNASGE